MTTTTEEETFTGLGRSDRRRLIKQWKHEGAGQSLKQWARANAFAGTVAQVWVEGKRS